MKLSLKRTFLSLLVLLSIAVFASLLAKVYFDYSNKTKMAIEEGKRVVMHVATGEVEDKKSISPPDEKEEPQEESSSEVEEIIEETKPAEEVSSAEEAKPVEKEKPIAEARPVEKVKPVEETKKKEEKQEIEEVREVPVGNSTPQEKPAEQKITGQAKVPAPAPVENKPAEKTAEPVVKPIEKPVEKTAEVKSIESEKSVPAKTATEKAITEKRVSEVKQQTTAVDPRAQDATAKTKPKIAIIITGMGLSRSSTMEAMNLPAKFTFSFSPYSSSLKDWLIEAKQKGHETLIDLPLEPVDYPISDPGPYALISSLGKEENLLRLKKIIELAEGTSGVITAREEKFLASKDEVIPLINELKNQNLKIVFASMNERSNLPAAITEVGISYAAGTLLLDDKLNREEIIAKLAALENMAKEKGFAIAVIRPFPINVKLLKDWSGKLKNKEIELVNLSEFIEAKK